jgi:hypothetical protein
MSKIAIKVEITEPRSEVLAAVRKATGMGFSDIRERILGGRPVVEYVLYYNDHDEKAQRLRDLLAQLAPLGVRPRIYELEEGRSLEELPDPAIYEVTTEFLVGLLDDYDYDMEHRDEVHPNE